MTRLRYATLAIVFLAGLLASGYAMSSRAAAFNASQEKKLWAFQAVNLRNFRVGGRDVSIADAKAPDGGELVNITFGDRELVITAPMKPGDAALPGLTRHTDWLRVLRFADHGNRTHDEFLAHLDEGNDRIAIVVKRPLTAPDPRTGDVWHRDWMFDFHELLSDGSIRTEGLRLPKTRGDKTPKPNELKAGTWQIEAALHLMPKTPPDSLAIGRPTAAFRGDAMKAMGWTLPAAALCASGLILCATLAAAPRRTKR
jgi:hypothetical protein